MSFRGNLIVNTNKNLLDPKVCRGENMIPNILRYLGVKEGIAKNPIVQYEITNNILKLACYNRNARMKNVIKENASPSKDDINLIVWTIQSSMRRVDEIEKGITAENGAEYIGIKVDREGNIFTKHVYRDESTVFVFYGKYELDENGNVVATESETPIINKKQRAGRIVQTYNKYGVEMKIEDYSLLYTEDSGREYGKCVTIERLEDAPFIALKTCKTIKKSALSDIPHIEKTYIVLFPFIGDKRDISSMEHNYRQRKPHNPNSDYGNEDDAIEYFNKDENKKDFANKLQRYFNQIYRGNKRTKRMISKRIQGLRILAKEAGLELNEEGKEP